MEITDTDRPVKDNSFNSIWSINNQEIIFL